MPIGLNLAFSHHPARAHLVFVMTLDGGSASRPYWPSQCGTHEAAPHTTRRRRVRGVGSQPNQARTSMHAGVFFVRGDRRSICDRPSRCRRPPVRSSVLPDVGKRRARDAGRLRRNAGDTGPPATRMMIPFVLVRPVSSASRYVVDVDSEIPMRSRRRSPADERQPRCGLRSLTPAT